MRRGRAAGSSWPLALAGALAVARAAVLVLRPGDGLIEPDPVDVREYFSSEDIARARSFGRPQLALHAATGLTQASLLAALVVRPRRGQRGRSAGWRARHPLFESSLAGAALTLAVGLAPLPLSALARRRALAVGLATQSWRDWGMDVLKTGALEAGLSAAAAPAGVALMRRYPRGWWLPGAAVAVGGVGALAFVAPLLLDPLFNRFTRLPAGELRGDALELAARAGVNVGEVYEVDASRRTNAANAYVTGLGASKRIVLFDTLLRELTRDEIGLVVAHELAHVRHRDVARSLAQFALTAPVGMYAVAELTRRLERLARQPRPRGAGAQPTRADAGVAGGGVERAGAVTLPALALALGIVGAALGSISSALSRRVESRADAFALRLTGLPEPFIAFERRLVKQNLLDPDPPRWRVRLLASHPPAVERIGVARAYARQSA